MFDDAKPELERILALVKLCPEKLQEKCFELLLGAYLNSLVPKVSQQAKHHEGHGDGYKSPPPKLTETPSTHQVPEAIKARFNSLVQRTKANPQKAAELFDFTADPFTYHALQIPDGSKREKMRSIALMLAVKEWLTSASWSADWKEFRAQCLDQNCWDPNNVSNAMLQNLFKNASSAEGIALKADGTKAAETLFAKLAGGQAESS